MQFLVFGSFVGNLDFANFSTGDTAGQDWWFNLIAIAALFMYLWKDVIAFYNSVWFWIGRKEEESGVDTNILSKVKDTVTNPKEQMKKMADTVIHPRDQAKKVYESMSFLQFRLGLIAVFVLYAGYALYSLLAIGNYNGDLVDKMSVAIQVFFVLEVDDWACALFILNPGVLDDKDFDQEVMVEVDEKRIPRRLLSTTVILIVSILFVYALSNYQAVV